MQPLSGLDSMFLSLETPTNLFQVGAVAVLDPSTAPEGAPPPYHALRTVVEDRLHLLHPFRRRLVTVPGGFDHPRWVEDGNLDLDLHLLRGALPSPGGPADLARYAASILARPLDRTRPLWEIHVVEGLEGGLVAGVAKLHHSTIDGVAGAEVTGLLMDLTPEVAVVPPPPDDGAVSGERSPGAGALVGGALRTAVGRIPGTAAALARLPVAAARIRSRNRRLDSAPPPPLFRAPRNRLCARLGPHRAVGFAIVDRSDVDRVRAATGATVNDVVLALTAGALRAHLSEADELPAEPLVAFVPVSVRPSDQTAGPANQLSGMLVSLATDSGDPLARVTTISESARNAKAQEKILGSTVLASLAELAVPSLLTPIGRAARSVGLTTRRPPFNVVVSSFAGPPFPLFCGGAELRAYFPFGPIIDGAALNVTAMSYRDQIGFGLLSCRDALGDVDVLANRIADTMIDLVKVVA